MNIMHYPLNTRVSLPEVNGLPAIQIGDYPVYLYAYALIALLIAYYFLKEAISADRSRGPLMTRFRGNWKRIFTFSLILFIIIDSRILIFHASRALSFTSDLTGMPVREKRKRVYDPRICDFADFCREKIPGARPVKLYAPDEQTAFKQLAYHLYPLDARRTIPIEEIDYILVFYSSVRPEQSLIDQFRPLASLDQGQFILKRIEEQ